MALDPRFSTILGLKRQGRLAEALAGLQELLTFEPGDLFLMASLADLHVRMNQPGPARRVLDEIFALAPDHPQGLVALGELELHLRRPEAALEALRRAGLVPHRSATLGPHLAKREAWTLGQLDRWEEALDVLVQAHERWPSLAGLEVERIPVLLKLGRGDEARELAYRLAAADPGNPRLRKLVLECRTHDRPPEEVCRDLSRVLSTAPGRDQVHLWSLRAKKAGEMGDFRTAAESHLEAHRLEPARDFHLKQAGFAFRKAGVLDRAVACLEPAFLEDPGDTFVRSCLLAAVRSERGRSEVVALLDRALLRHPGMGALMGLKQKELREIARDEARAAARAAAGATGPAGAPDPGTGTRRRPRRPGRRPSLPGGGGETP